MIFPVTPDSTAMYAKKELGGKGFRLYLMTGRGLPVPSWVGIPARAFRFLREETPLGADIREALDRHRIPEAAGPCARRIRKCILQAPLPTAISLLIRRAYAMLGEGDIAVRSSAAGEDSSRLSFAGQLSTFLFVNGLEAVEHAVRECWASGFSKRALSYRAQSGIATVPTLEVCIVLQRMAVCEKSGVLFTVDPVSGDPSVAVISSVYGLGEGLVSGLLAADTFRVQKATGAVLSQIIAEKETALRRAANGGLHEEVVEAPATSLPSLSQREIAVLAGLARDLEDFYHAPQDVEWGFEDGALRVLQSRPITALKRPTRGDLHIWDNSNIVESYGGITLPLTFTFAKYVYSQVYEQFCEVLNVPRAEMRALSHSLQNMLGSFSGRVYYNLLNWYKLLTIIPGFSATSRYMEMMMGVSESLAGEVAQRVRPVSEHFALGARLGRLLSGLKLLYFHFAINGLVKRFLVRFHRTWDDFRRVEYSGLPAQLIYERLRALEANLLHNWHVPVVNDCICMVHFGILKALTHAWLSDLDPEVQNDLLAADGHLESAEPTRELIRMAGIASSDPQLKSLIEETPPEDAFEALAQSPHRDFYDRVRRYIDTYGFRCINEMKLESRDLHQDPSFLFVCLRNYLRQGLTDLTAYERREREIREAAEAKVRAGLSLLRRPFYWYILRHARVAVRNRENTRFCRTRIYGVLRSMAIATGEHLAEHGLLDDPPDIFYLTLPELYGVLDATLTSQDLRATVAMRKAQYERYRDVDPAPRFMTRGIPYCDTAPFEHDERPAGMPQPLGNELRGLACSPGVVEGVAKVILAPSDDLTLDGEILVALRTDPGWIPLYPSARGLLVERGSLLSHSAVVAREMGLPTIVGIRDLTRTVSTGMHVRMDGGTGVVVILDAS